MKASNRTKTTVTLCAALFFFACTRGDLIPDREEVTRDIPVNTDKETQVSVNQATDIAKIFFGKYSGETNLRSAKAPKTVSSIETVNDSVGSALMYVINFSEGGFVIVGATRNYYPVLAYSDDNSFTLSPDMGAVSVWMGETENAVKTSDALDDQTKKAMQALWNRYEMTDSVASSKPTLRSSSSTPYDAMMERMNELYYQYGPDGWYRFYALSYAGSYFPAGTTTWDDLCNTANSVGSPPDYTIVAIKEDVTTQQVGPLLTTQWHQLYPFNYLCPNGSPAGCVAIAMAQIMKFHQWPTSFNWSNMPDYDYQTTTSSSTPALIKNIGDAVKMVYDSTSSSAYDIDAKNAFQNNYSYNATLAGYNATQVRNEILNNKRPVYMSGTDNSVGKGHAWVCDGAKENNGKYYYFVEYQFGGDGSYSYNNLGYTSATYPGFAGSYNSLYFYMKWGQLYGDKDGWFIGDNINLGDRNYQSGRVNIFVSPK